MSDQAGRLRGVLAAEVALQVLGAFIGSPPLVALKALGERSDMHPAKVHRYLTSLCRCGFVRQDPQTGRYQLSDGTVTLGLAAMESLDPVAMSRPILRALRETTQLSASLAIWDAGGPVVALQDTAPAPLTLSTNVGSSLPLLSTSAGWIFCAWLPQVTINRAIHRQESLLPTEVRELLRQPERMEKTLATIRRDGLAHLEGQMSSNVHGLSAPVFDGSGHLACVISLLGGVGQIDPNPKGVIARALTGAAVGLSTELGWHTQFAPGDLFELPRAGANKRQR